MRGCAPARVDAAAVIRMAPGYAAGGRRGRQGRHCICAFATVIVEAARSYDRRCDGSDCARDRCRHVADGAARGDGGVMITVPAGIRVLVATKPVDFRKGGDGLAALVREALGEDPFSGTIFVFRCKRADRVKILAWDGSGLVLFWKRLEHGAFRWPPISNGMMRLSASQLAALVDGMDWSRLYARDVARPTATS